MSAIAPIIDLAAILDAQLSERGVRITEVADRIELLTTELASAEAELERDVLDRDRVHAARVALAAAEPLEPATVPATELVAGDSGSDPEASEGARTSPATDTPDPAPSASPAPVGEATWEQIAATWVAASKAGDSIVPALIAAHGGTRTTVQNWPARLRKLGLIPPTGVMLQAWLDSRPSADSAGIADPPPATEQELPGAVEGCRCEESGCKFVATGPGARADIRRHTTAEHTRKASALECTVGVIE